MSCGQSSDDSNISNVHSSPSQQVPESNSMNIPSLISTESNYIQLNITIQPQDQYRFRYRSELKSTHGSLQGKPEISKPEETYYPTVQATQVKGCAIVKCSLYQAVEDKKHPHTFYVGGKFVEEAELEISEENNYTAEFKGLIIVHAAKVKKQIQENHEKNAESKGKKLSSKQKSEISEVAKGKTQAINLNKVRMKFSLHDYNTYEELPILGNALFSDPISNAKSPDTNIPKICLASDTTGKASGNQNVMLFVEKVRAKNVRINFFQLDEFENRIWSTHVTVLDHNLHHQYGISFSTPPYKDPEISSEVAVFMELQRLTDGKCSEPIKFTYVPDPKYTSIHKPKKRKQLQELPQENDAVLPAKIPANNNNISENPVVSEIAVVSSYNGIVAMDRMDLPTTEENQNIENNSLQGMINFEDTQAIEAQYTVEDYYIMPPEAMNTVEAPSLVAEDPFGVLVDQFLASEDLPVAAGSQHVAGLPLGREGDVQQFMQQDMTDFMALFDSQNTTCPFDPDTFDPNVVLHSDGPPRFQSGATILRYQGNTDSIEIRQQNYCSSGQEAVLRSLRDMYESSRNSLRLRYENARHAFEDVCQILTRPAPGDIVLNSQVHWSCIPAALMLKAVRVVSSLVGSLRRNEPIHIGGQNIGSEEYESSNRGRAQEITYIETGTRRAVVKGTNLQSTSRQREECRDKDDYDDDNESSDREYYSPGEEEDDLTKKVNLLTLN